MFTKSQAHFLHVSPLFSFPSTPSSANHLPAIMQIPELMSHLPSRCTSQQQSFTARKWMTSTLFGGVIFHTISHEILSVSLSISLSPFGIIRGWPEGEAWCAGLKGTCMCAHPFFEVLAWVYLCHPLSVNWYGCASVFTCLRVRLSVCRVAFRIRAK